MIVIDAPYNYRSYIKLGTFFRDYLDTKEEDRLQIIWERRFIKEVGLKCLLNIKGTKIIKSINRYNNYDYYLVWDKFPDLRRKNEIF